MFSSELDKLCEVGENKIKYMDQSPLGYFILSALAGCYVGFGIILIFSIGGPISVSGNTAYLKLIMGASFGIALSLVIFAGSELFTGNNMVFAVARLKNRVAASDIFKLFFLCYLGNLAGSALLAWMVVNSGSLSESTAKLILHVSILKTKPEFHELILRGILCNWLVCLAVWVSGRTQNDAAKLILIFWCLFAFIASGFEHCVANMTLLSMGLLLPGETDFGITQAIYNLVWVTIGNFAGGAFFVGGVYWLAEGQTAKLFSPTLKKI
jgi:nitrite transporter